MSKSEHVSVLETDLSKVRDDARYVLERERKHAANTLNVPIETLTLVAYGFDCSLWQTPGLYGRGARQYVYVSLSECSVH